VRSERAPGVSVVMPVYNAERWLPEAVDSILRQSADDLELLIVDNGSTDRGPELANDYARRDGRIRVLFEPRRGLSRALNRGLEAARGALVARLDADDLAAPDRLERQAAFLAAHPDVGLVGSWAVEIDDRGRPVGQRTPETRSEILSLMLGRCNPFIHSSVMLRTDLVRELGGYRPAFEAAEDYDLWLRIAEVSRVANLPEALVSYRIHGGGVSRKDPLRQAFSVRLAKTAAAARRQYGADPTEGILDPPDWRCALASESFYARDAALYRWLDLARSHSERSYAPQSAMPVEQLDELSHVERRLAAWAMLAQITSTDQTEARQAVRAFFRLCRERPGTVLSAAWSLRRGPIGQDRAAAQ